MSRPLGPLVAVDFGGVCSVGEEDVLNVAGCEAAIDHLRTLNFRPVLVSFCGARRAQAIRDMLTRHTHQRKGRPLFDRIIFVKDKATKVHVCHLLGASVMIDDTEEVLDAFAPTKILTLHFGTEVSARHRPAPDWAAVQSLLQETELPVYPACPRLNRVLEPLVYDEVSSAQMLPFHH